MIHVKDGNVILVPTTFEWSHKIDQERAEEAYNKALKTLEKQGASETEIALAQARLKRALIRKNVAAYK